MTAEPDTSAENAPQERPRECTLAWQQVFRAPVEDVVWALFRAFEQNVRQHKSFGARMDPGPLDGIQCASIVFKLEHWPPETPPWVMEAWHVWMGHHSWMVRDNRMLWRFVPLTGGVHLVGETRYTPGPEPRMTQRRIQAVLSMENAGFEALPFVAAAFEHFFKQEQDALRTILHSAGPVGSSD